jgi:RHS repeat-associated protein
MKVQRVAPLPSCQLAKNPLYAQNPRKRRTKSARLCNRPLSSSVVVRSKLPAMIRYSPTVLTRTWSLFAVFVILGLVVSGILLSEPGRAVASVLCIPLLIQSWVIQRKYARSRERLVLLSLVLSLPALAAFWLGLNVLRFYLYDPESPAQLYSAVVRLQEVVQNLALALGLVVIFWAIVDLACFLAGRISTKLVGRRKTWWNRRFKGTWLLGSPIGCALAALISSSLLRWLVVVLSVWGCIFALVFRLSRPHMGRFMSPDPSGMGAASLGNPQSLNLYSYVLNNPLRNTDPDGRECVWDDGSFDSKDDAGTGS